MAITADELIECVRAMTIEEKVKLIAALHSSSSPPSPIISGARSYQDIVTRMSSEERDAAYRMSLCSQ